MAQLFYKIDDETQLHVLSLAYNDDLQSSLNIFSTGSPVFSGSSGCASSTSGGYAGAYSQGNSGNFPSRTNLNTTTTRVTFASLGIAATWINTNTSERSIFEGQVKSVFSSLKGTATLFEAGSYTIHICDNRGYDTGVSIVVSNSTTWPYYQPTFTFKSTSFTGTSNFTWSVTDGYNQTSLSAYDFNFFFFTSGLTLGVCCLITTTGRSSSVTYNNVVASASSLVYTDYSNISPFMLWLTEKGYVYGASGADADESNDGGAMSTGDRGGGGTYDFPNDDIDISDDMPASSPAITAGFINPYYVTASEIASLGNFLWSSDFFDSIAKTFSNPMDCIISLSSFPLASSSMSLGSSESVRVGNTTSSSTGTRLISEIVTIDCGTVSVPEVWGSYLDYAQTKLYIYIPYLGIEELPLCECMGGSVACELRINLLTGALVACVTLTSGTYVTGSARVQPIYFSTTCKSDIPVSGATTGALAGAFQLLGGAVSSVAGIATGVAPLAISGLASAAQGVATMQSQNSQISGAVGAAGGQMAHKIPFLIFDRPVQSVPANLASIAGYQSNSGTTLSRCSGYVICDTINLDGLALTRSELEEVEQICTSGVYIS